ncbi:MAG: hypothetical protein IJ880_05455 [Bacilli bacterium]|nr:hypothetical protein [Bacilli bacterium]
MFKDNQMTKTVDNTNFYMKFDKSTGYTEIYGKSIKDNPIIAPAPTHLDIEICGECDGCQLGICGIKKKYSVLSPCYKDNISFDNTKYMSFDKFKQIFQYFDKRYLTQIAFGTDARLVTNPDIWKILKYTRNQGIIPNLTCASVNQEDCDKLVDLCGAVAVSRYQNKNYCYDTIQNLSNSILNKSVLLYGRYENPYKLYNLDREYIKIKDYIKLVSNPKEFINKFFAINMHILVCEENYENILETIEDIKTDKRLEYLNAIVLLTLKTIGRGVYFTPLSKEKYKKIIQKLVDNNIKFGSDSCGCSQFYDVLKEINPQMAENNKDNIERCESTRYSFYIDYTGKGYPCSFCPGKNHWKKGIKLNYDFWNHKRVQKFREININCKQDCPAYGNLFTEEK